MKIKNPETGEVIVIPQGMEDAVRDAIESGNDPIEAMQMKYGGIHINPANKGKFNATKKATGKTTEELTHSKNPLTRKRAVFAQNASRWKHQDGGQAMQQQQPQGGGQEDQMQQLIQMAEQALVQGASPEEVAQMLIQQGVPEQVVQQVIQYAIQDLQQQQQAQGQNPEEQMQQQNPQEEQVEMRYGGYMQGGGKSGKLTPEEIKWLATSLRGDQDPDYLSHYPDNSLPGLDPNRVKYLQDDQKAQLREYMKGTDMITDVVQGLTPNISFFNPKPSGGVLENKGMPSQQRFIQKGYGGMSMYDDGGMAMYGNGGGIDNPGFRALPAYVQQDIINNMRTGGKFLRKAELGTYEDNSSGQPRPYKEEVQMDKMPLTHIQNGSTGYELYGYDKANPLPYNMDKVNPIYPIQYHGKNYDTSTPSKTDNKDLYNYDGYNVGGSGYFNRGINHLNNAANYFIQGSQNKRYGGLHRMDPGGLALSSTSSNATWGQGLGNLGTGTSFTSPPPTAPIDGFQMDPNQAQEQLPLDNTVLAQNEAPSQQLRGVNKWASGIGKAFSNNNVNYGKAALETTKGIEDLSKGTVEIFGNNRSNRNALGDEANNLRSAMRNDYQRTGKRPTDGNAIISKYGGRMMQDGGATYADKMKVSKDSPEADFIAEKGEYIVNNGVASKLETGGSHASGNDTAISLDKSSNPSYVLSDTPRLKQLQFGGKRVSPSKYAEMATVEALGKTPDQILKAYTSFTKRAGTEGKVFGDRISDATNQLLAQKYQKDLATVKQIADQAYHKQEQLKYAMGMDNDLDHAQEVNGMSMAKSGGMQDGVHMNYFNAPAVQYGGSPQLFSDPSGLGYNTTQMAYGGLHRMQPGGGTTSSSTVPAFNVEAGRKNPLLPNMIPPISFDQVENEEKKYKEALSKYGKNSPETKKAMENFTNANNAFTAFREFESFEDPQATTDGSGSAFLKYRNAYEKYASTAPKKTITSIGDIAKYNDNTPQNYSGPNQQQINFIPKDYLKAAQEYQAKAEKAHQDATNAFNAPTVVNAAPAVVAGPSKVTTAAKNIGTTDYKVPVSSGTSSSTASASNSNASASNSGNANPSYSTSATGTTQASRNNATATSPSSDWTSQKFKTREGIVTTTGVDLNKDPSALWETFRQKYTPSKTSNLRDDGTYGTKEVQENLYDAYLDTPEGRSALKDMWKEYGLNIGSGQFGRDKPVYKEINDRILRGEDVTDRDLEVLRGNFIDDLRGKRLPKMLEDKPAPGTTKTTETPPATQNQEVDKKKLDIETAGKKANYDIPAINAYIPQSYGRNPIGLQLAQAQTIRPAKLNIQSELNEYNRGMRGALRGTQGNTSVNVAQQMQGLNNLYGAQNKLYGQKYNFDEQSRMGADQFNAQAIMNTDAANIQRIGVNQDAIARREGAIDTQRRTDFQAGIENADKQNAYGLSKEYIESTFGPYLNNEGKLNFAYNPTTGEKINKDKEKSYTVSQINKMTAEERKAQGFKFGGSVKKIKLKLRK